MFFHANTVLFLTIQSIDRSELVFINTPIYIVIQNMTGWIKILLWID